MATTFPGTTIETLSLTKGCSRSLFDGVFATGGITLSQVSIMTGLEPYLIQNWVKRGFVSSPTKRVYSKDQFARILIINMLREVLQIERICALIQIIGGAPDDPNDDLISDSELYHRYVDLLSSGGIDLTDRDATFSAAQNASADFSERNAGERKKLAHILQVMLYAHTASTLRDAAENILSALDE